MPRLPPTAVLCISFALAGIATGCGDGATATTTAAAAPAKPAYCADVTRVRSAIQSFADVPFDAGVIGEVQSRFTALRTSVDALRTSAGEALRPQLDAVTASLRTAGDTITSMRDTGLIATALVELPGDVDAVTTAVTALLDDADRGCR